MRLHICRRSALIVLSAAMLLLTFLGFGKIFLTITLYYAYLRILDRSSYFPHKYALVLSLSSILNVRHAGFCVHVSLRFALQHSYVSCLSINSYLTHFFIKERARVLFVQLGYFWMDSHHWDIDFMWDISCSPQVSSLEYSTLFAVSLKC